MIRRYGSITLCAAALLASVLAPAAKAQLWTWTKDQMVEYTKGWTGDRFPDGRPKVPDQWLERAKDMSQEEIIDPRRRPRRRRVYPIRGRLARAASGNEDDGPGGHHGFYARARRSRPGSHGQSQGERHPDPQQPVRNRHVAARRRPGGGSVTGRRKAAPSSATISSTTSCRPPRSGGLVVDGSLRDLDGISAMPMPCYYRAVHPSAIGGATLAAVNVPIRIGNVTVMPGDLVVGDREGVSFIPAQNAETILDRADETHIHDEWTRRSSTKASTSRARSTAARATRR